MNAAAPERSTTPTDKLSGVIERVTFFNEESGFCVLRVKAPGHREEVTVIGSLPSVSAGEWLSGLMAVIVEATLRIVAIMNQVTENQIYAWRKLLTNGERDAHDHNQRSEDAHRSARPDTPES